MDILLLLSVGLLASFMAGLFGIGGGILLMPSLLFIFNHTAAHSTIDPLHLAINTSMLITFLNALLSLRQQLKNKNFNSYLSISVLPGSLIGVFIGISLSHLLSTTHIKLLAGLLFFSLALLTLLSLFYAKKEATPGRLKLAVLGAAAGAPASFLGLGGGIVLTPLLSHFGVDTKKVVSVSVMSTCVVLFITLLTTLIIDYSHTHLWRETFKIIDWMAILSILPVMLIGVALGGRCLQKIKPQVARAALSAVLFLLGAWLCF